jgi:uncharacterized protein YkwD
MDMMGHRFPMRLASAALMIMLLAATAAGAGGFEDDLLGLINGYRGSKELKPLVMKPDLTRLAMQHSRTMKRSGRMSHDGFDARFKAAGKKGAMGCMENVGWNQPTAASLLEGWQNSPGHDRNLLDPQVTSVGIARAGTYTTFFACY